MAEHGSKKSRILDSIEIVPYVLQDGVPTFRDSEIIDLWVLAVKEKALDYLFLDMPNISVKNFLAFIKQPNVNFFVVLIKKKPAVIIFLTEIQYTKAECHFFYFDGFRGQKAVEIGQYCLDFLINMPFDKNTYIYDIIIGITPVNNIAACQFLSAVGMTIVGVIPNYLYNAHKNKSESIVYSYYCRGEK